MLTAPIVATSRWPERVAGQKGWQPGQKGAEIRLRAETRLPRLLTGDSCSFTNLSPKFGCHAFWEIATPFGDGHAFWLEMYESQKLMLRRRTTSS